MSAPGSSSLRSLSSVRQRRAPPAPLFVGGAENAAIFPALKSVAKGVLVQLRASGP
jgi:hypothetical protein